MSKKEPTQPEVFWEHKWLFVIIPVQDDYYLKEAENFVPETYPLLAAYCKTCDTYYTKGLVYTRMDGIEGKAGLPQYGCVGPTV